MYTKSEDGHIDINTNDARQGKELGVMRIVLGVSFFLAVGAMAFIFMTGP